MPPAQGEPGPPPRRLAEALSSQYGLNLFVAGLLLLLAWAVHAAGAGTGGLLCALSALMLAQLLWMLWHVARAQAQRRLIRHKDAQAGARWLRGSIILFAVITIVLGCLKVGYFVGFSECLSVMEGVFPVMHAVHTLLQVYFLWEHAKDVIQSFKTLERFGVIHSVFTNLLLWAAGVLNESKHQLNEHKERLITLGFGNITMDLDDHTPPCNCSPPALCSALSQAIYYLYPFNIEYQILASTMFYVLWKNVGRQVADPQPGPPPPRPRGLTPGSVLGLAALAATIGVVALYLAGIGRSKSRSEAALLLFYLYASGLLLLMGLAGLAGLGAHGLDTATPDAAPSPARQLDAHLLVGTASGSWLLSWGSVLALLCAPARPAFAWAALPYSLLVIAQEAVQNAFILRAAPRAPLPCAPVRTLRVAAVDAPPASETPTPGPGLEQEGGPAEGARRSLLRSVTAFLFLCNISLWIPPAFGCRPEYDNGLEETVFGFEPWIIVVNLAMPFSIFYRMHAAASLFDVYCKI